MGREEEEDEEEDGCEEATQLLGRAAIRQWYPYPYSIFMKATVYAIQCIFDTFNTFESLSRGTDARGIFVYVVDNVPLV